MDDREPTSTVAAAAPEGDAEQDQQHDPMRMRIAANFASQMAAISVSTITCGLHEHCDGSCGGNGPIVFKPLQVGEMAYGASVQDRPTYYLPLVQGNPTSIPSDDFQYTPIDSASGEIRVLQLHEAVFRSDPIVVDLVTINIHDANRPQFGALSYHWGEPIFDQAIVCDGKKLLINTSLQASLKRHRSDWTPKPEFLWVDAICINQKDKDELTKQLVLMGDIYSGAFTVFVDFGDVQKEWYLGYDLMCRARIVRKMLNDQAEDLADGGLRERVGLPSFSHSSWHMFGVIYTSPWLRRTWTIQEVVLAREVSCRYGRFCFDWSALIEMHHLMALQGRHGGLHAALTHRQILGSLSLDRIMRIRLEFQAGVLAPLKLLWRTRDCLVSNPRDKVVGLLGMLVPTLSKEKFEPDYTWPVEMLFYHFAKYILRNCRFSDRALLLSFAGLSRRGAPQQGRGLPEPPAPLPTWVPDWLAHGTKSPAVFAILREKPFNAVKGTLPVMYPLGEYGKAECFITQTQYSLGTITNLSKSEAELRSDDGGEVGQLQAFEPLAAQNVNAASMRHADLQWLRWHNDAAKVFYAALSAGNIRRYQDAETAFALTLLAGDDYKGVNATATSVPIEDPSEALEAVVNDVSSENPRSGSGFMDAASMYKTQTSVACRDRRFAVTEQGYIGLVPSCSKLGDQVSILGGVTVPFVLRPRVEERKYELVGDSYVQGIMEGEVAEGLSIRDWDPLFIY